MALMSYLIRDAAGTYYFRRVIPPALRPFMPAPWTGKSAWKRTLGTKDHVKAKRAAPRFLSACAADFEAAERVQRGEPTVRSSASAASLRPADIEADVLAELLAADDAERSELDPRKQLQTAEDRAKWRHLEPASPDVDRMEEDHFLAYGDHLAEELSTYRRALSRSDLSKVDGETRRRLREGRGAHRSE